MNQLILIFGFILVFASCSQKQFTFRKKIKVNNAEIAVLKPIQNDVVSASNPAFISNDKLVETYHQPLPFIEQTNAISTPNMYVLPDDTIRKKYNFGDNKSSNDSLKNEQSTSSNKAAKDTSEYFELIDLGFRLGAIMQLPLIIRDLILSKLGLKSKNHHGSTYARIKAVFFIIMLSVFLILVFLMIIKALGYI
ncbi:MAG: hypothetical protein KBG11_02605 [Bacteroidia bacterium]|nr:hypothetical protein [Bacteroidia bacterium]